jgi:carbonic anhydrase
VYVRDPPTGRSDRWLLGPRAGDEDVRQSIARIKASPFIPHKDAIRGFVFDVDTGALEEVKTS